MMQNLPWSTLMRDKQVLPFNITPQVEQQERDCHQEEAQCRRTRGRARADLIHQAITGFNSEAPPILFGDLLRREAHGANDNVGEVVHAVPFVAPFAVAADNVQRQCLRVIDRAFARVGSGIAFAPHEQGPRAAVLAAHDQGQNRGKGLLLQESHNPIVIKAAIYIQPFDAQPQVLGLHHQALQHILGLVIPSLPDTFCQTRHYKINGYR